MNMTKTLIALAISSTVLTGCGGGGDSKPSAPKEETNKQETIEATLITDTATEVIEATKIEDNAVETKPWSTLTPATETTPWVAIEDNAKEVIPAMTLTEATPIKTPREQWFEDNETISTRLADFGLTEDQIYYMCGGDGMPNTTCSIPTEYPTDTYVTTSDRYEHGDWTEYSHVAYSLEQERFEFMRCYEMTGSRPEINLAQESKEYADYSALTTVVLAGGEYSVDIDIDEALKGVETVDKDLVHNDGYIQHIHGDAEIFDHAMCASYVVPADSETSRELKDQLLNNNNNLWIMTGDNLGYGPFIPVYATFEIDAMFKMVAGVAVN